MAVRRLAPPNVQPKDFAFTAANAAWAKKQIENWILWIVVDVISVMLYLFKGIYFLSLEYVIFLVLATWGLWQWRKKLEYA